MTTEASDITSTRPASQDAAHDTVLLLGARLARGRGNGAEGDSLARMQRLLDIAQPGVAEEGSEAQLRQLVADHGGWSRLVLPDGWHWWSTQGGEGGGVQRHRVSGQAPSLRVSYTGDDAAMLNGIVAAERDAAITELKRALEAVERRAEEGEQRISELKEALAAGARRDAARLLEIQQLHVGLGESATGPEIMVALGSDHDADVAIGASIVVLRPDAWDQATRWSLSRPAGSIAVIHFSPTSAKCRPDMPGIYMVHGSYNGAEKHTAFRVMPARPAPIAYESTMEIGGEVDHERMVAGFNRPIDAPTPADVITIRSVLETLGWDSEEDVSTWAERHNDEYRKLDAEAASLRMAVQKLEGMAHEFQVALVIAGCPRNYEVKTWATDVANTIRGLHQRVAEAEQAISNHEAARAGELAAFIDLTKDLPFAFAPQDITPRGMFEAMRARAVTLWAAQPVNP